MKSWRLRAGVSITLLSIGALLLGVTCVGGLLPPAPEVLASGDGWDRIDPALVRETSSVAQLLREARRRTPEFDHASREAKMHALFDITSERFNRTAAPRQYGLTSNWILYLLGYYHVAFSAVLDPDTVLRLGSDGSCDQISYVLLQLALRAGILARHVGLYGHVVMEAWYDDDWHMYDPHMEVVPVRPDGRVYSVEDLSRDRQAIRRAYQDRQPYVEEMVQSIGDRRNNSFISYPEGAHFVWKVDVLAIFQAVAEWLKYVIPLLMLIQGWWLWRPERGGA
jgi:hypothetical protein